MSVSAIKNITLALDGSPASDAASRYATEFAQAGATLSPCTAGASEPAVARADAIVACAKENASDIIIIGSDARHEFVHLRDGVSDHLMAIAGCPVIFIHENDSHSGGDIAVAISGYDTSYSVLDAAIALAKIARRDLFLITEITVPKGADYYSPGTNAETRLADAAKRALAEGVKSSTTMGDGIGSIAGALIQLAKRRDCSMIVTGHHTRSGLARFFNGSLAHQIVLDAHVPVAVIHHAFEPQP